MSFSFGGGGASAAAGVQQPPAGGGGGGLFGQPQQAATSSQPQQPPATSSFAFGSAAAPAPAAAPSASPFAGFGATTAAAGTPAPAPAAPALAPGGLFGGFGAAAPPSQGQQQQQQPQQAQQQQQQPSTAPTPAPAPAPATSFSFGGLAGAGGAGATTPAPAPPTSSSGSTALTTTSSSTSTPTSSSNQSSTQRPSVKVDLRSLFDGALTDPCLFSDEEISEQLDQLLEPGEPSTNASRALQRLLQSAAFRERVVASLEEDRGKYFYAGITEQTGKDFDSFVKGQKRLVLLHGWEPGSEATQLQGKDDLVEGVQALAQYLRLAETRAMQVLFLYLKDQLRRGLMGEIDSREYVSQALHERVRRFYHNQRVFFLKNLQEFLRIDLDPDYFQPDLRREVQQLLDGLSQSGANSPSLGDRLQGAFRALCQDVPPRVQDLSRAHPGSMRQGRSPASWGRVRQEWVEQNVVEQGEVLTLLLLALAQRVSLGFRDWCQLLELWGTLRMGELPPEKAYLAAQDATTLRRARRVSGMMALVAIQGLQLGLLALPRAAGGIGGEEHPFAADLMQLPKGGAVQLEELFYAMRDPARAEECLPAPELISVVLLFFTCFLHLSGPGLRSRLPADLQHRLWDRAAELQAYVTQRAAQAHLAELVATLLLDDEEAATTSTSTSSDAGATDQWARLGFHAVLRREADRLRPGVPRPEVEAVQVPLSEAVNALVAACYAGLPQGPPPLHQQSMTTKKLEFLVFLVATIYHGHSPLAYCFWEGSGLAAGLQVEAGMEEAPTHGGAMGMQVAMTGGESAGHPLEFLATEARERHPLLYFHLVSSMACDATTATWVAVELSRAPLSTQAYDERVLEHLGGRSYRVREAAFFDPDTGVSVPPGTEGELVQAAPGRVPRLMRWDMSLWAAIVHQLEDFAGFLARCHLLPMLDTLEGLRRKAVAGEGLQELGFNTVVDRCPSLFVYGPCPARTEDVVRELMRRGAWGVVRYILRRVEMVLDQFSLLLGLEQRRQQQARRKTTVGVDNTAAFSLLDVLSDADGVVGVGMAPLAQRLPARLFDLVRVASEALTGRTEAAEMEALVDLQASALTLLGRLVRTNSPLPWRAEAVQALVVEVGDVAGGQERVPVIVWLGLRSMEAERTLNQYRITRDVVLLMQSLVESACDANWEGKEVVLPPGLSDDFVTRLVDFATQVLLSLDGWTFTRSLDRWLLALTCLELLATYTSRPFAAAAATLAEESTWGLEAHRQSLLGRFREDGALLRMLLRCAEYLPASAMHDTLVARTKRRAPYNFLDQLHPDGVEEGVAVEAQGLFLARDGILPLAFEHKGLGSTASREEMAVLERLGIAALQTLSYVIKQYLASPAPSSSLSDASLPLPSQLPAASPGALEMLMRGADVAFPGSRSQSLDSSSQVGGRRPLVTHVTLIASLVTYGEAAGGATGMRLSVAAVDVLGLVVRYLQRVRRLRQRELVAALPDWPGHLPYPFPPGVIEDILSVTDARGFRRGLFAALARPGTPGGSLVAMLDLLVDVMRLQPSLAKHLVFFRPRAAVSGSSSCSRGDAGEDGAEQRVEEVVVAVLRKAQAMVQADLDRQGRGQGMVGRVRFREVREGGSGMLVLASALRFLCVCLRRATSARRLELLAQLDPAVWNMLEWAVQNVILEEATEVKVAEVLTHCHRLSVHRFVLEILSLLTTVMIDTQQQQQQQGGGGGGGSRAQTLRNVEAAVPKLTKALLGGPHVAALLSQYLTASFRPKFVEDLGRRASGPHGEVRLTHFRLPDWGVMLTDSNPRRFGSEGFLFDLPALVRHLHATQVGAEMSESKRTEVERAVRLLNQYYSISAAQHMLNKACKGLLMVLIGRVRPAVGTAEVWNGSLNIDDVAHTTLLLLAGDESRLPGEGSAFAGPGGETGYGSILNNRSDDSSKEAARRLRADGVDVARKMRQPMLELVLTIVDGYGPGLSEEVVRDTLRTVRQSFEELKTEEAQLAMGSGVGGGPGNSSSSELLLLDLRQCLLTTSLILLQFHPLDGNGVIRSGQSELEGVLAYTINSLASLDMLLIEGSQEPAAPTCRSERLEAVLRTALTLLGTLLTPQLQQQQPNMPLPALAGRGRGAQADEQQGDDEMQQQEQQEQQQEAEATILREFRERRVLPTLLGHWTAASKVAAAAFPALHDYTTVSGHAARSTAASEAGADRAVQLALKRLSTLLRFLETAACASKTFCGELLREGWVMLLMEDPTLACLVRAVEGGAEVTGMEQLLYRRGYRADGEESPYYALWRGVMRLMTRVLHALTRPHLGYEAVLALPQEERDPALAYANPLTPEEAKVVREVAGFWRRLSPLLLWPLGEDKVLTLGLLREAQSVLALAREMAVHGYTWRVAEPARAEELRALIKSMVVRTSLVLGQAMAGKEGTPVLAVLGEAFAPVSPAEVREHRVWEEGRCESNNDNNHNGNGKSTSTEGLEGKLNEMLMSILGSALGFLRYTGPLRLPKHIPLTPEEAAQVVLAEGTRVWYRDGGGSQLQEGIIQRRVRAFYPQEACRMGTYDIVRRRDHVVETGVRPERVAMMEDREQEQDQAQDLDFDVLDLSTGIPSFNHGRLSAAHLLVLARYALDCLRRLSSEETGSAAAREEQEGHCTNLLVHALYLLLVASRTYLRSRGGIIQNKERVLPRFMTALTDVLWDASEWRLGRPRPVDGNFDTAGGGLGSPSLYPHGHSSHHHVPLHDMFASVSEADSAEERMANMRERIDQVVARIRQGQELGPNELQSMLTSCFRCMKNLPAGLPAWLVLEARQHDYHVGLGDYAAALRAGSQDSKLARMADLLDDMIESVGLPTLLQELNRKAVAAAGGATAGGEGDGGGKLSYLMLPE